MPKNNAFARKKRALSRACELEKRPLTTWQDDVAWLKSQFATDGKPGITLLTALLQRHPEPADDMGTSLLAWMISGNPDPEKHPKSLEDASNRQEACKSLARDALHLRNYRWAVWALDQSPDPSLGLRLIVILARESLPSSSDVAALSPGQRKAWDTLWWRMAQECSTWGPGNTVFGLGLHHSWPPVNMELDRLPQVLNNAQTALGQLENWQRDNLQAVVVSDMKRVLLEQHVVHTPDAQGPGRKRHM